MTRCGCASGSCSCAIIAGIGASVTGTGATNNPYIITGPVFQIVDTPTVDMVLLGTGTAADPFVLSANTSITLDGLYDVEAATPALGYVLAWTTTPTPAWRPVPPTTAPTGAISVNATSISGDGSSGLPLAAKLQPGGGISPSATGLYLTNGPLVVTSMTRPSAPTNGMLIYETDTRLLLVYDSTYVDWVPPGTGASAIYTAGGNGLPVITTGDMNIVTLSIPAATFPRIITASAGCLMHQTGGAGLDVYFITATTPGVFVDGKRFRTWSARTGITLMQSFLCPASSTPTSVYLYGSRIEGTGVTTFEGMTDIRFTYIEAVTRRG